MSKCGTSGTNSPKKRNIVPGFMIGDSPNDDDIQLQNQVLGFS